VQSHRSHVGDRTTRKAIDTAIGIIIALRGCSPDEAFAELADVVHRSGIGLGATSDALVALATGVSGSTSEHLEAFNAWGSALADARSVRT